MLSLLGWEGLDLKLGAPGKLGKGKETEIQILESMTVHDPDWPSNPGYLRSAILANETQPIRLPRGKMLHQPLLSLLPAAAGVG